jgi:hypothetical protein
MRDLDSAPGSALVAIGRTPCACGASGGISTDRIAPELAVAAGLGALAAAMGIGRFASTPLLPLMKAKGGVSSAKRPARPATLRTFSNDPCGEFAELLHTRRNGLRVRRANRHCVLSTLNTRRHRDC